MPGDTVNGSSFAGSVNVIYGRKSGLSARDSQRWSQASRGIKGAPGSGVEAFGRALASGDFDRDGRADLAIGVPADHVGHDGVRAGAVNVLYGSPDGLRASGDQLWSKANLPGTPRRLDGFGSSLVAADFDHDGYWDLAIGAPYYLVADAAEGSVTVLFGGPTGLSGSGAKTLHLRDADPAATGAWFGAALAAADVDDDGWLDLAVGAPAAEGQVAVFPGTASGPDEAGAQLWSPSSPGLAPGGTPAFFGAALTAGDYDGDGVDDLAIGIPGETYAGADDGGAVAVLFGSDSGLSTDASQRLGPPAGVPADDDYGQQFGATLASGDFDGDDTDDLAVGAPWTGTRWGAVVAYAGSPAGLDLDGAQVITEATPGVPGTIEGQDQFGAALASGDFGGGPQDDLAIGAPGEEVRHHSSGRVTVLLGGGAGLSGTGATTWSLATPGIPGEPGPDDGFGSAVAGATP